MTPYAGVALETGKDYTPWNAGLSASWQRPEANTHWAELMYDQGTIPFVHLMVDDDMESIAAGSHDAEIDEWLKALKRYQDSGRRMVVPLFPEMNGNWTPYGQEEPLNHSWFIDSFRSIVSRARAMGISTEYVQWCFAPNDKGFLKDTLKAWYPGDEWCQVIGGSVYNWGGIFPDAPWLSPAEIIEPFLREIRGFTNRRIVVTQTGSGLNDPKSPGWLSQLNDYLAGSVEVDGVIYFSISEFEYGPGVHDWNDRMSSLQSGRPLHWFNQGEDVDYRTIKNVPDSQWARNVVDTMLCLNVITEGDGSDWEKPLKNGTIWNYLDRYTAAIQRGKIDNC